MSAAEVEAMNGLAKKRGAADAPFKMIERETVYFQLEKDAEKVIKTLKSKIRIHLSGTPYKILMGSEFEKEDIIAFCQFDDIIDAKNKWNEDNINKDEKETEWVVLKRANLLTLLFQIKIY